MEPGVPGQLGERLFRARNARGLSQRELARRAGLSATTVSQIESGDRGARPSASTVAALEKGLGEPRIPLSETSQLTIEEMALCRVCGRPKYLRMNSPMARFAHSSIAHAMRVTQEELDVLGHLFAIVQAKVGTMVERMRGPPHPLTHPTNVVMMVVVDALRTAPDWQRFLRQLTDDQWLVSRMTGYEAAQWDLLDREEYFGTIEHLVTESEMMNDPDADAIEQLRGLRDKAKAEIEKLRTRLKKKR